MAKVRTGDERPHVLHVGGDAEVRAILGGAGFRVTAAAPLDALPAARSARPDVVLVEVASGGDDARAAVRALRADAATAAIPALLLEDEREARVPTSGEADLRLPRRLPPHALVRAIETLLRLRRAEARYRRLADANVVGIVEFEPGGAVLAANDECLRIAGVTREALEAGRVRWDALVPAELRGEVRRMAERLRSTGAVPAATLELERPDGARVPVVVASAALGPGRALALLVDVAERLRVERERLDALAHAEAAQRRLAFLLSVSGALLGGPETIANGLRRVAGLCAGVIADWCAIDRIAPGGVERVAVAAADAARNGAALALARRSPGRGSGAIARALADGEAKHLHDVRDVALLEEPEDAEHRAALEALGVGRAAVHPLVAHGRVLGALTLVRARRAGEEPPRSDAALAEEVAARAATALENARLHEELARAVRAREDALAEVSHDLRNPLASVLLGATQLERAVDRPDLPGLVARRAASIRRSAERMSDLVRDLLDLARFEAGRLSLDLGDVDVAALVSGAVEDVRGAARAQEVRLESSVPRGLAVRGDAARLGRVVSNLLSNAIRASPAGGRVEVAARATGGGIEVSVRDEGPGIPPEVRAHLFERYWRGREAARGGVGLGLSIAKALVQRHGGRISVESAAGRGTTVAFFLPG